MNRGRTTDWYEEEEFWDYFLPILVEATQPPEVVRQVDQILERLEIADEGGVLDLGCGIGRHALELAQRRYHVLGVDRTTRYLEIARARAQSERLSTEFIWEDMRTFRREAAFDGIISIFTSFGYFKTAEQDKQAVRNVYESLRPGGAFLVDVHGKENLARVFRERDWRPVQVEERNLLPLEERELLPDWEGIRSRWIFIEDDRRAEFTVTVQLYAATELVALLRECGFKQIDVYGSLDSAPYDHTARRLVAVGRK